jgi:hypothetical protein
MSYHYSATPHFRELFDCPSYFYVVNKANILAFLRNRIDLEIIDFVYLSLR